jgi:uncharacterized sulfatase
VRLSHARRDPGTIGLADTRDNVKERDGMKRDHETAGRNKNHVLPTGARRALRWLGLGLGAAVGLVVLYFAGRIVFYRQTDDGEHLESKRAYLERIADLSGGSPSGPNFVVVLFDDLGYGDIGAYGGRAIRTPNIDRLAASGALFRHAYAPSPYCSASRAGLMTGRYPIRSGMDHVLQAPGSFNDLLLRLGGLNRRLPAEEITLAEVLHAAGYATAIVGKWHLGGWSPSLPVDLGFESFYGMLYSNDQGKPAVWEDRRIVEEHPIDQTTLTRRYTERAVAFIERTHDRPFFLYLPHTFPHIPLHAAEYRRGNSEAGLYGDVVEELDDSVGAIVDALERTGAAENTLVILSSDNGPWFQGSPGGIRGRKFDVFEGGTRVPFIVSWLGQITEDRVIEETVGSIDLFPTFLELAGLPSPDDRAIDGQSLVALLRGTEVVSREPIYYHQIERLRAVRQGRFKYHDRHGVFFGNPMDWPWGPMKQRGPWLFDLATDPDESYDVAERYPETTQHLRALLERRKQELATNPRGWR